MQTKKFDIVIVGAGLIGSALALMLAKKKSLGGNKNFTIALVERSEQLQVNANPNQRVVALGKLATDVLDEVGVMQSLSVDTCYPYQSMYVWDENSDGQLFFEAQNLKHDRLGYMIDSVQCTIELQKKVARCNNIHSFYGVKPESLERDAQGVKLTFDQTALSTSLVVAADGGNSWVRTQSKIFANHRSYNQYGIVAKIETEKVHEDTAWQRFLSTGPVALLPVSDNQCSIVWSVTSDYSEQLMSISDADFEIALQNAIENKLGKVTLLSKRVAFPLVSQQAEKYFVRNTVLVGDAAHRIHPLAGQGANLGFKDIRTLSDILCVESVDSLADIHLLKRYQSLRQSDNNQVDLMMSVLHHAYELSMPAWLSLRSVGMNLINRSEALKSWLLGQASGK